VPSLLADYAPLTVPSHLERLITGHRANVKCVDWISDGLGVSGSSDSTLRIFSTEDGTTRRVLAGHQSRLWDVATSPSANYIASGSGDGTVRIWSTDGECASVLAGDGGDVYGVTWQPGGDNFIASACYDKILRVWSVETGKLVRTFSGHAQSTLAVAYDPTGRMLASG
jgi:WD40 repeat protein